LDGFIGWSTFVPTPPSVAVSFEAVDDVWDLVGVSPCSGGYVPLLSPLPESSDCADVLCMPVTWLITSRYFSAVSSETNPGIEITPDIYESSVGFPQVWWQQVAPFSITDSIYSFTRFWTIYSFTRFWTISSDASQ
jgi:hypothetical protein